MGLFFKNRIILAITSLVISLLILFFGLRYYYNLDSTIKNNITDVIIKAEEEWKHDVYHYKYDIKNIDYEIISYGNQKYAIVTYNYTDYFIEEGSARAIYLVERTWYGNYLFDQVQAVYNYESKMHYVNYSNYFLFWGINDNNFKKMVITTNLGQIIELDLPDNLKYVIKYDNFQQYIDYDGSYPVFKIEYKY